MPDRATLTYPLTWPDRYPRTSPQSCVRSRFLEWGGHPISLPGARDRLERVLQMIGVREARLSTNLPLKVDGSLRVNGRAEDVGVALHFKRGEQNIALAADKFDTVESNIAAIAAYLEALRATERHGVGSLDQVFTGYLALPPPVNWREVLGHPTTMEEATATYRRLAKAAAATGNPEARLRELNLARDQARKDLA